MASSSAYIMAHGARALVCAALVCTGLGCAVLGCAGGPSHDAVMRSEREYDLGRGLYGEGDVPGAFEHLLDAVELDPDNAEAHLLLANLFFLNRSDYERAEHHFREALRAAEHSDQRAGLPSDARNSLGVMYIHMERCQDAIEVLRASASDLMNHEPGLARANLGWAYIECGDRQAAIEVLTSAVQQAPQLCVAWYRLAQVRLSQDQLDRADEAVTRAVDVEDPTCQRMQAGWRLRGEIRARLDHRTEAIHDLERCVELSPDNEDGRACQRLLDSTGPEPDEDPGSAEDPSEEKWGGGSKTIRGSSVIRSI
ncbi:MAG: tetratricopeptide repeat protein [Sandaracinaceae bacterium]